LKTKELPLPPQLKELLQSLGYEELYPPQCEAVAAGVLQSKSLLMTTPTASGKTLVALMAAGKIVLEGTGTVVYLVPLRALANEKYEEFKALEKLSKSSGEPIKVMISTGDYDSKGEYLADADVLILTNEKFDSLIRHGASWIEKVRLFVIDEVHTIGEDHRGPTLEFIVTKIRVFYPDAQILALSATIANAAELSEWIGGSLIDTAWRPVPLVEGVFSYGTIRFSDGTERRVSPSNLGSAIDIAVDVLADGGQSLIFAETRRRAVSLALKASTATRMYLGDDERSLLAEAAEKVLEVAEETELGRNLAQALRAGAAFHHAGLHPAHRRIVEEMFKKRLIKVLTSTPTLAAGVNLPARRVVIASLMRYDPDLGGQEPIKVLDYKQMCGRAGRPRYDKFGETVIVSTSYSEADGIFEQYINGPLEPLSSQLSRETALRTHILATIASMPGLTDQDISNILSNTLLAKQRRTAFVTGRLQRVMSYLEGEHLVEKRGKRYLATEFGSRISMLYIDPATGVLFRRAINSLDGASANSVGLLHLITLSPDFAPKFPLRSKDIEPASQFVEEHRDEFIFPPPRAREFLHYQDFLQEMRSVMVLNGWIEENHEDTLLKDFNVEPGDIYRATDTAEWLLYSLGELCRLYGKEPMTTLVNNLRQRVTYGVKEELLPLVQLRDIGRVRARALYRANLRTPEMLAQTSVEQLARIPKVGLATARSIKAQVGGLRQGRRPRSVE